MIQVDELQVFRGKDFVVNEYLSIEQKTLDEICDFGEKEYFGYVSTFCSTPSDLIVEFEQSDWEFFTSYGIYRSFGKKIGDFMFKGFDFTKLLPFKDEDDKINLVGYPYYEGTDSDGNPYLLSPDDYNEYGDETFKLKICGLNCDDIDSQIIFTEDDYIKASQYIRKTHKFRYNKLKPGNKNARKMEVRLALRDRAKALARKDKSDLLDMISAMTNVEGFKYGWLDVWEMKINAFLDAVSRVQKIKNANLLLQSGYSGFGVDLSKLSSTEKEKSLNWLGSLD